MCFVAQAAHYATAWPDPIRRLRGLSALNRINALACIRSARHGWLGASYSACETLTTLHFGLGWRGVVLSKGHAAALQYACLYGLGLIDRGQLLSYKDGPGGLQAHTDRRTPGVLVNTGSLGQALSKVAALAFCRPDDRFAVVLGDGELQEGQNYEAFQTIVHHDLRNLVVVIDDNGLQTALPTDSIKRIASRRLVLEGFGFDVAEGDGHDPAWLLRAIDEPVHGPRALIAHTRKAGGSDALAAAGPLARWHAEVPDDELTDCIVAEQVERANIPALRDEWIGHIARRPARRLERAARDGEKTGSTGQHFARRLAELATTDPRVIVLDGDLAGPCGVSALASALPPGRFVEMGIAEQDMVSFAGGLALEGLIPVVNTYASFYKRAIEQISVNQSEAGGVGVGKVVYAGHYAGLGYYTDGSTHQSLNDLGLMRSLPGLVVVDPVDGRQTAALLDWAVAGAPGSVYFRLRRIGLGLDDDPRLIDAERRAAALGPLVIDRGDRVDRYIIATGPIATRLALDALEAPELGRWGLAIQSVFGAPLDLERWRALLDGVDRVMTIEDGGVQGGLHAFVCELLQGLSLGRIKVRPLFASGSGWSFRTFEDCCRHHMFVADRVRGMAIDEDEW